MREYDEAGAEIWGDVWPQVKAYEEAKSELGQALSSLTVGDVFGRSMQWGFEREIPKIMGVVEESLTP